MRSRVTRGHGSGPCSLGRASAVRHEGRSPRARSQRAHWRRAPRALVHPRRSAQPCTARASLDEGGTGSDTDRRRRERKHRLHAIALIALAGLAGCGGGSANGPTIAVQPARQFRLTTHMAGTPTAGRPAAITFSIQQPDGANLTLFRHGSGPHTGVHVIYIRSDLGAIVHHHPHIAADGSFTDTVAFPSGGPYRVIIDVYPQQTTPQPNFQLFTRMHVNGAYSPQPLPPPALTQVVGGYRFTLHSPPHCTRSRPRSSRSPLRGATEHPRTSRPGTERSHTRSSSALERWITSTRTSARRERAAARAHSEAQRSRVPHRRPESSPSESLCRSPEPGGCSFNVSSTATC